MTKRADMAPSDQPDDPGHTPYEHVQMVNPTLPDSGPITVTWMAFTILWQPRGWVLYTPPVDPDPGGDDTPPDDPAEPQEQ